MRQMWFQSLYWLDCVFPEMPNSWDSDCGQTSTVRTHKWRQACGTHIWVGTAGGGRKTVRVCE